MKNSPTLSLLLPLAVLTTVTISSIGCIGFAANMLHAIHGNNRPAAYDGLAGKRIAVVVSSDKGIGTDATSSLLTSYIEMLLNQNMDEETDVVRQSEVERWLDSHGWNDSDYVEIGTGVDADCVLAVEVMNMKMKDGATLYRGQADITASVYDIASGGKILFKQDIPEFSFPQIGGTPITDTSEAKFRSMFLTIVSQKIAGLFYEVEATQDFAQDAISSSF